MTRALVLQRRDAPHGTSEQLELFWSLLCCEQCQKNWRAPHERRHMYSVCG